MKKETIAISLEAEKLRAIKKYMKKKKAEEPKLRERPKSVEEPEPKEKPVWNAIKNIFRKKKK